MVAGGPRRRDRRHPLRRGVPAPRGPAGGARPGLEHGAGRGRRAGARRRGLGAGDAALFESDGIAYEGTVHLRLRDDGLAVDFDGRALVDFARNRIGLVVLHPAADAGRAVQVTHTDGGSPPVVADRHQPAPAVPGRGRLRLEHGRCRGDAGADGRRVRDRGPAELDRRLVQDLQHAAGRPFPVAVPAGAACHQGHGSRPPACLPDSGRRRPGQRDGPCEVAAPCRRSVSARASTLRRIGCRSCRLSSRPSWSS